MATRYDITADEIAEAFGRIEEDLLESMFRNLERHTVEEAESGFEWAQWQAAQLAELEKYARSNGYNYGPRFAELNARMEECIQRAFENGHANAEAQLLQAAAHGFDAEPQQGFLRMPRERMDALIKATTNDMQRAEYATLRKASDVYRQTIFTAQTYAVSGAGTYGRAIDMATRDFVSRGINGIMYRNGSMHGIEEYSRMAVRTAAKRAALVAEGEARREWGVHTVFVNYRVDACPECMEWVGRVLIDDVYSGGTAEEAAESGYPLLSEAMAQGLFHPNCRDTMSTYFEGISELPDKPTDAEVFNREQAEIVEQWSDRMESEAERNERLSRFSLDFEDRRRYAEKADEFKAKAEGPAPLTKDEADAVEWYVSGDGQYINQLLRGRVADPMRDYEREAVEALDRATDRTVEVDTLWRSVDASALFGRISDRSFEQMEDLLVYGEGSLEGVSADSVRARLDSIVGKSFTDSGFMSTTKDMQLALDWRDFTGSDHPVVLEIKTGGSAKGLDLGRELPDLEARMEQDEVLLARGSRYRITGYRAEQGQIVFEVELENDAVEVVPDRREEYRRAFHELGKHAEPVAGIVADVMEVNPDVAEVAVGYADKVRFMSTTTQKGAFYNPLRQSININLENTAAGTAFRKDMQPFEIFFHEFGHLIDNYAGSGRFGYVSLDRGLGETVKREIMDRVIRIQREMGFKKREEAYDELSRIVRQMYKDDPTVLGGLGDMVQGATSSRSCAWGVPNHKKSYYTGEDALENRSTEAFAEFFECAMANPRALETLREWLPDSYKLFMEIIHDLAEAL